VTWTMTPAPEWPERPDFSGFAQRAAERARDSISTRLEGALARRSGLTFQDIGDGWFGIRDETITIRFGRCVAGRSARMSLLVRREAASETSASGRVKVGNRSAAARIGRCGTRPPLDQPLEIAPRGDSPTTRSADKGANRTCLST
jgi:hypothetical protein